MSTFDPSVRSDHCARPMARIVVIDNYDSFTYNLVQHLEVLGASCDVILNDACDVAAIAARAPHGIVISPGPCTPDEAGVSLAAVRRFADQMPILGVCLGHQSIGQAFGGKIVRADRLMHGKTSPIVHDGKSIFRNLSNPFTATRYHSLLVEQGSLPSVFEVSAWTTEGEIMGLRHKTLRVEGVQFHPESILTEEGMALLKNWLGSVGEGHA
jgi:anthranilate synthase/aminodeoxychorismate synthase-like glutamine amidotransferase